MDIARPELKRRRQRRRALWGAAVALLVLLVSVGLGRLDPAAPTVERATILTNAVQRGEMIRQVRGNGTLVPERIVYVQAQTDGRIERILALAGAEVSPDTVLLELSNPELQQAAFDLEWQLKASQAQMERLKVQIESDRLTQESAVATLKADRTLADLESQADTTLAEAGLVPEMTRRRSQAKAIDLGGRLAIEQRRLDISVRAANAQVAVQEAEIAKLQASLALKREQVAALHVRAGIDGVLQQLGEVQTLQVGQRVNPGATLAKIVQPTRLKAEIKINETQARDVQIGQRADIDTRNGVARGRVTRVDPAVLNGTVTVDVAFDGPLPRGARPDLSVEGVIELERLTDVLHVGRPVVGQSGSTVGLFKLVDGGRAAVRVPVKLGRYSVSVIEVVSGLDVGDQVILSDMSAYDAFDKVRLR